MRTLWATVATAALLVLAGCGSPPPADEQADPQPPGATTGSLSSDSATVQAAATEVALFAVGDVAACDTDRDDKVAKFLASRSAPITILGDTVYDSGTPEEYQECFDPLFGSMLDRIHPAVGNHEYRTPDASGYFNYFGDRAGRPGKGWYAFNLGDHWKVIVLNSNCSFVGGCEPGDRQYEWLKGALERARPRNVLAVTHAPRYSTGEHGSQLSMKPFFRLLYRRGADIMLSGHDHSYERFRPQNAIGERRSSGVQQFVVGTGGRHLYEFSRGPLKNTAVRDNTTYGVMRLELRRRGYSWKFIPVTGGDFTDGGSRSLD